MQDDKKLTVTIDNTKPIPVEELRIQLNAWNNLYKPINKNNVLAIKEIRQGSIVIELASIAKDAMNYVSNSNEIITFGGYVIAMVTYFVNKKKKKSEELEKPELNRKELGYLKDIFPSLYNDNAKQIHIKVEDKKEDINLELTITNEEGKIAYNNIEEEIKELETVNDEDYKIHKNVLLDLIQINNDIRDAKNTKGIIQEIIPDKQLAIVFTGNIKDEIMNNADINPFAYKYLVNVKHCVKEKQYIILELFDKGIIENVEEPKGLFDEEEN